MNVKANNSTVRRCFVIKKVCDKLSKYQDFEMHTVKEVDINEISPEKDSLPYSFAQCVKSNDGWFCEVEATKEELAKDSGWELLSLPSKFGDVVHGAITSGGEKLGYHKIESRWEYYEDWKSVSPMLQKMRSGENPQDCLYD